MNIHWPNEVFWGSCLIPGWTMSVSTHMLPWSTNENGSHLLDKPLLHLTPSSSPCCKTCAKRAPTTSESYSGSSTRRKLNCEIWRTFSCPLISKTIIGCSWTAIYRQTLSKYLTRWALRKRQPTGSWTSYGSSCKTICIPPSQKLERAATCKTISTYGKLKYLNSWLAR